MLKSPLPRCPKCGDVARPNILMFDDWSWLDARTKRQRMRFEAWLLSVERMVVVELGAGRAIPTVRIVGERHGPRVIRINPDDYAIDPAKGMGWQGTALGVLDELDNMIRQRGRQSHFYRGETFCSQSRSRWYFDAGSGRKSAIWR